MIAVPTDGSMFVQSKNRCMRVRMRRCGMNGHVNCEQCMHVGDGEARAVKKLVTTNDCRKNSHRHMDKREVLKD